MYIDQTGVTIHDRDRATPGFTIFSPIQDDRVFLTDMDGEVVHQWDVVGRSGANSCSLTPEGNLWMIEKSREDGPVPFSAGLIREYDWDGIVLWEFEDNLQHHEALRLDTGGLVYLAWELLDPEVAAALPGDLPGTEHEAGIWGEVIRETDADGNIVWEWRVTELDAEAFLFHRNAVRRFYGHANSLQILPDGNYLVSLRVLNLLIIVERSTGKVIWKFQDDELGGQHDAQMLENGNILVFANGMYASDMTHSSVWEIDPKTKEVVWKFKEKQCAMNFYSPFISGCQRLDSGNTLICEGSKGVLFETTPECDIVWQYVSPYWREHPVFTNINWIFKTRRYAADSPEIRNRV